MNYSSQGRPLLGRSTLRSRFIDLDESKALLRVSRVLIDESAKSIQSARKLIEHAENAIDRSDSASA